MISQCMNPDCRKDLHYLRDGRVVRVVQRVEKRVRLEHFWLCGECHLDLDFCFSGEGRVSLTKRRGSPSESEPPLVLTLVA